MNILKRNEKKFRPKQITLNRKKTERHETQNFVETQRHRLDAIGGQWDYQWWLSPLISS